MREKKAKKDEPVFTRGTFQELGGRINRTTLRIPACTCNHPMPKTRAKAAVCANCGGAILTALERWYVKALPK
jgi:hypothetical protein